MKFHWFAEVTYPSSRRFRRNATDRVGHDSPQAARFARGRPHLPDVHRTDGARRPDGLRWARGNEHHQSAGAMTPSPNLLAATLARTTQNAAILVIGDSLALYNPPTRVAEEMAYIDCLSEGRPDCAGSSSARRWTRCTRTVSRRPNFAHASAKHANWS